MPYIGVSPQFGVRRKHTYTATAGQTSFSGAGSEGATLSYKDSNFVDVYQNGVKLGDADYTSTSGTAIVLAQGASVSDLVEIIVFDAFSAADTVSKADGGTFDGDVTFAGAFTSQGIDDNADATAITIESDEDITITKQGTNTTDVRFANSSNSFGGNIKYDHNVGNMIFEVHNGERLRIRSDGGICFNGDTAAANALDDYEEGTHTFVEVSGQASITNNRSHYTKIGRLVAVQASITVGSNSNSNPLNLSLPFSSTIDGYYLGGGNISYTSMSATYINDNLRPLIANAAADVSFIGGANAGGSALTCAAVSGARIDFHILYFV